MNLLLDRGANIDAHDEDGDNALMIASRNGDLSFISLLLGRGGVD